MWGFDVMLCKCGREKDYRANKCKVCVNKIDWTKEEEDIIIKNYPKKSSFEISNMISRSDSSIRHRAVKLLLTNNGKSRSYKQSKYSGIKGKLKEKSPNWKGGRYITTMGYVKIYSHKHPSKDGCGYVLEHRLVVEDYIGRYLKKSEVVHHIDFNKKNNKINNLMLFPSDSAHTKFHIKTRQFGLTNPIMREIQNRWINLGIIENEN